jgi:hypothetical protein
MKYKVDEINNMLEVENTEFYTPQEFEEILVTK